MTYKEKFVALVADLAKDLREHVARIEAKPETTQNHYGDYLGLIGIFDGPDGQSRQILAAALIEAGANPQGVKSALKIYGD